jgi:signal transduction histidine kinase
MDLDEFPDGILVADADGIVVSANAALLRMAKVPVDMVVGRHVSDAMPFDDLSGHTWFECTQPYSGLDIRTRISEQSWWSPRGNEYLVSASLIRDKPRGTVIKVIVSVRSARIRSMRDRERSDMVATVAHELRSPLTGIKGFASTLLTKWSKFSDEQRQFMLETVDADADRLTRLITELLDAARIDAGRLTLRRGPVRLDELVRRVLINVSAGSGHPFELTIRDDVPLIWGDADRLTQVVTNLIENALRHGHGINEVIVQKSDHPESTQGVALEIHDNGPGIPVAERERVFSRFWKSGPGAGSGLGMYIVKGILNEHGGEIHILDSEGGGANVMVWLPVNEPDALTD